MSHLRQINPWMRAMLGVAALAAAAIAVTVATASGADAKDSEPEARGDVMFAPGPPPAAVGDFADCMSEHGVDVPQPGEPFDGEPGVHEPTDEEREALEACEGELPRPPHHAFNLPAPPNDKAFRECMSKHGADLPPPPERRGNDD